MFTTPAVTDHTAECFSQHTPSATVGHVCHAGLTNVERVIDFSIVDLGGLTPGSKVTKRVDDLLSTEVIQFLTPQSHPRSNVTVPIESLWVLRLSAP